MDNKRYILQNPNALLRDIEDPACNVRARITMGSFEEESRLMYQLRTACKEAEEKVCSEADLTKTYEGKGWIAGVLARIFKTVSEDEHEVRLEYTPRA